MECLLLWVRQFKFIAAVLVFITLVVFSTKTKQYGSLASFQSKLVNRPSLCHATLARCVTERPTLRLALNNIG